MRARRPLDRRNVLFLLWGGLLGASPLPAWAADPAAPLDDHAKAINRAAATPEGSQRVVEQTGVPVDQLIAEHKSGKGWGAIAKERNVTLGPMVSELKKSDEAWEAKAKKAEAAAGYRSFRDTSRVARSRWTSCS